MPSAQPQEVSRRLRLAGHDRYVGKTAFRVGVPGYQVSKMGRNVASVHDFPKPRPEVLSEWAVTLRDAGYRVVMNAASGPQNTYLEVRG